MGRTDTCTSAFAQHPDPLQTMRDDTFEPPVATFLAMNAFDGSVRWKIVSRILCALSDEEGLFMFHSEVYRKGSA